MVKFSVKTPPIGGDQVQGGNLRDRNITVSPNICKRPV